VLLFTRLGRCLLIELSVKEHACPFVCMRESVCVCVCDDKVKAQEYILQSIIYIYIYIYICICVCVCVCVCVLLYILYAAELHARVDMRSRRSLVPHKQKHLAEHQQGVVLM